MALTNTFTASAEVKFGGQTITRVNHVMINQRFETHHDFEVSVSPSMLQDRFIKLKDVADRFVGNDAFITLQQSRTGLNAQKLTFRGIVTSVRLVKGQSQSDTYLISGMSVTVQLSAGPTTRSFTEQTFQDIIKTVMSPLSALPFGVSTTNVTPIPYITQYEEDNFHFLQRLSQEFGEWMFYDGATLIFGKSIRRDSPNVQLVHGTNLFDMEYSLRVVPLNFTAKYFNYEKFDTFKSNAADEQVNDLSSFPQMTMTRSGQVFSDDLFNIGFQDHANETSLKKAVKLKRSEQATKLAVFTGQTPEMEMKIGGLVTISEPVIVNRVVVDTIDYGTFVVTRLNHFLDSRGVYQANFEAIPQDMTLPPVDYHIIPPIARPQVAIVKSTDDPMKLGRVKVEFWWQKINDETTPFIRVSNMMTGRSKSYFIPEVDDIVMVDFEYGNPDLPYVAGSMYSNDGGARMPGPELFTNDDHIKGFITKGGNHIIFDDTDGKEKIRIFNKETKNKIELSMDGGSHINIHSNGTINMSAANINIKASKKLHMVADEEVLIDAGQSIGVTSGYEISLTAGNNTIIQSGGDASIVAGSDATIQSGTNFTVVAGRDVTMNAGSGEVSIEAKKDVSVKATANLNLEGGPMTVLKGKIVAIN